MEIQQPFSQVKPTPKLLGIGQLFKKTLQVFKKRIWVFIGIMIIPILAVMVFLLLSTFGLALLGRIFLWSSGSRLILILSFFVALIVITVSLLWPQLAILYAVKEREIKIGAKEALRKGWPKILSLYWIMLLSAIVIGLGSLLLFIPGLIFWVWFSLADPILVAEDIKGWKALLRSKKLVKGNWWQVFFRLIPIAIISLGIQFLFESVFSKTSYGIFFSYLLVIPWFFFVLTFIFLLYENLKELEGKEAEENTSQ